MDTENRQHSSDLSSGAAESLAEAEAARRADLAALTGLSFFQLVERLQARFPDMPRIGTTAGMSAERVRFKANPTLGFPPSEVERVEPSMAIPDGLDVTLNLIGLFGPASPLPTSVTERIVHAEGNNALGDFLDLFNHRLAGLLALIWTHYRHDLRYRSGAADPISLFAGALFGLMPQSDGGPEDQRRLLLLPYAGLLSLFCRSAAGIAGVLTHALDLPCRIEEFIERRITLPESALFRLGGPRGLGEDMILGEQMSDIAGQFRVWIGPMNEQAYRGLLPGRASNDRLSELLELVVRDPLAFDVGCEIEPGQAPALILSEAELGWTSWLLPAQDELVRTIL